MDWPEELSAGQIPRHCLLPTLTLPEPLSGNRVRRCGVLFTHSLGRRRSLSRRVIWPLGEYSSGWVGEVRGGLSPPLALTLAGPAIKTWTLADVRSCCRGSE